MTARASTPRAAFVAVFALLVLAQARPCRADLRYTGVNLAGADFAPNQLPGTYNTHYTYPTPGEVDYFLGKGGNTFRLPFLWERLQPTLNAPFNAAEFARLDSFVNYATGKGAYVVLDPHNYARYRGTVIGTGAVSNAAFGDFWTRLADTYEGNGRVIFGLMNEPNNMPSTEHWVGSANAALSAIRAAGAGNLVLVPGNAWTGAHSWSQNWYGTPNATAMLNITDPGDHYAYEVHQYLDGDSSGTTENVVSPTIGSERLAGFTRWLRDNGRRGFLGEFGAPRSQVGYQALDDMLDHVDANADVWEGWTYWAAGPWWGEYRFTVEPTASGQDRPQMAVLQQHFVPEPGGVAVLGALACCAGLRRRRSRRG